MRKKKVLHIVEAFGGGVFTYLQDLSNAMAEQYDIYILHAIRPQTPIGYQELFDSHITLIKSEYLTRAIRPSKDFGALLEIRNVVKDIKPDLVHLHSSKAGVLGRWVIDGRKIPVFYTPHGYSFLMRDQSKVKRMMYWGVEAISARRPCTTISCSLGEHEETLRLTNKATYVNNGINTKKLQKLIDSIPKNDAHPFTVFTLGRICYQKNPGLFNQIAKAMPDTRFLWIGDGELRSELTAPNIEITGWVDRQTALEKSVEGDVFLLTSLWEGLPISLLEAMYMKKICVVSNVIGNRDVIYVGKNGFVCEDCNQYVSSIRKIRNCEMNEIRERAYWDVIDYYSTTSMVNKYGRLYKNALISSENKFD